MYAFKLLFENKQRFIMTSFGIALCSLMMFFMVGLYEGIYYGSIEYVKSCKADLWVLQKHSSNILRNTSLLKSGYEKKISQIDGVKSVSPVFLILATVRLKDQYTTLYISGYDQEQGIGGPPKIIEGRNVINEDEIVIDRSFAAKYELTVGDKIPLKTDSLLVTGISDGTNMFVVQYAFVTLKSAYQIVDFRHFVSCFIVRTDEGFRISQVKRNIEDSLMNVVVFNNKSFIQNNVQEMESGVMPMIYVMIVLTAIVLAAILSLILSLNVMERRKDFAIMKTIGSPRGFITGLIIRQSLIFSFSGLLITYVFLNPMLQLIEKITPEVSAQISVLSVVYVSLGIIFIGFISTLLPLRKLRKIYPLEVFS